MLSELIRDWAIRPIMAKLQKLEYLMANVSDVLNQVADGLSGPLYSSVSALLAENAELRGEDAGESEAAERVRSSFADISSLFAAPELPDVPAELPAEGETPAGG